MSYKSEVRIVIKTDSLNILKEQFNQQSEFVKNLLNNFSVKKVYADITYLGWKQLNSDAVDVLQECMIELENEDKSYRMTTIGENLDDIEQIEYTNSEDFIRFIPYPSLTREFDEKDMELQLRAYNSNYNRLKENEEIAYE